MTLAVIGLDGFDMTFDHRFLTVMPFVKSYIDKWWTEIRCDTAPHSAPSWFTIFTGVPQYLWPLDGKVSAVVDVDNEYHNVHGFYQFSEGENWATEKREGDKPWNPKTIQEEADRVGGFVWQKHDGIAQGVMCIQPHYSYRCVRDKRAYYDGKYDSAEKAKEYLDNFMATFDRTISLSGVPELWCGVFQIVDQVHHHYNSMPFYEHSVTMREVDRCVRQIAEHFDDVILLSDHGVPDEPIEYTWARIRLHSHRPRAFITHNGARDQINGTLDIVPLIDGLLDSGSEASDPS